MCGVNTVVAKLGPVDVVVVVLDVVLEVELDVLVDVAVDVLVEVDDVLVDVPVDVPVVVEELELVDVPVDVPVEVEDALVDVPVDVPVVVEELVLVDVLLGAIVVVVLLSIVGELQEDKPSESPTALAAIQIKSRARPFIELSGSLSARSGILAPGPVRCQGIVARNCRQVSSRRPSLGGV